MLTKQVTTVGVVLTPALVACDFEFQAKFPIMLEQDFPATVLSILSPAS